MSNFKYWLSESLSGNNKSSNIINSILLLLIIISISAIPLVFFEDKEISSFAILIEQITITVFTLEYFLRIWISSSVIQYIFSKDGIIDFLVIAPFYLHIILSFNESYIYLFIILRFLRILKIVNISEKNRDRISHAVIKKHGLFEVHNNETIEFVAQRHPFVFLFSLLIPLSFSTAGMIILANFNGVIWSVIVAIMFFLFAFLFFFKASLDYHYDVLYITNERLILQHREFFGVRINDINYKSITNIKPTMHGFFRWLLNFGDLEIHTAAENSTIKFYHAEEPQLVVHEITKNRQNIIDKIEKLNI